MELRSSFSTKDDHLIETVILNRRVVEPRSVFSGGLCLLLQFLCNGLDGVFAKSIGGGAGSGAVGDRRIKRGRSVRNVVFMGMGEPLLNQAAVFEAVERLIDPAWFNLSGAHVTVSTVGIAPGMRAFTERFPTCRLALSLHSARQSVRERLCLRRELSIICLKEAVEQAVKRVR